MVYPPPHVGFEPFLLEIQSSAVSKALSNRNSDPSLPDCNQARYQKSALFWVQRYELYPNNPTKTLKTYHQLHTSFKVCNTIDVIICISLIRIHICMSYSFGKSFFLTEINDILVMVVYLVSIWITKGV